VPVMKPGWRTAHIIRNGRLVSIRSDTTLRTGDEAVVRSADPDAAGLAALFTAPAPDGRGQRAPPR
jgi:NhaP-type Na+/H+ and K+/H+ antiporter